MTFPAKNRPPDAEYTPNAAQASHCWFSVDRVPRDAATTAWKRHARFQQAGWREAQGYPMGSKPYGGAPRSKPIGSRLELGFANGLRTSTGACRVRRIEAKMDAARE